MSTHLPPPSEEAQSPQSPQSSAGTQQGPALGLPRKQRGAFPELYGTAADYAQASQDRYFLLLRLELIAVFVAALAQFVLRPLGEWIANLVHFHMDSIHVSVVGIAFSFSAATATNAVAGSFVSWIAVLVVIILTVLRYYFRLDEKWHARRSLAEAVLVLTWRYSMKALPGDLPGAIPGGSRDDAEFADAYQRLLAEATTMDMPPPGRSRSIITDPMRALRAAHWVDRRAAYLRDRLDNQNGYYLGRARHYHTMRNRLRWAMIGCYVIGGLLLPFNGLGTLTTAAGAIGTWLGAKHYGDLSQSYSAMQRELDIYRTRADNVSVSDPLGAEKWSQLVNEIETSLAGEHQDWLRRVEQ